MTGHRTWDRVRSVGLDSPTSEQRNAARVDIDSKVAGYQSTLSQLRRARGMTQVALAESLGVTQSQVSRLEHQVDLYLSSLRNYVRQLGGDLQLRAVFEEGDWAELSLADLDESGEEFVPAPASDP